MTLHHAHLDTIIIGAGQAGPSLASALDSRGEKVALIEEGNFGGTCLDGPWRDRERNTDYYASHESISYVKAWGRLAGRDGGRFVVQAGESRLTAARVIINTGARAVPPDIDGLDQVTWHDHHSILDLKELPARLVMLGGSYIGLELGQTWARFGSHVTILERGERLASREDPDVSEAIAGFLRAEGLDTVGVQLDSRGYIVTDDHFASSVPDIYAVGDVNGRGAFTHSSYQDSEILADHLTGGGRSVTGRVTTYAMITDPPLGRVGMTSAEAKASGARVSIATYPMDKLTRAVLNGHTAGLARLSVDEDADRILGATVFGPEGDEAVHVISLAMHAGMPASTLATWLPIHPTVAEFWPTIYAARE